MGVCVFNVHRPVERCIVTGIFVSTTSNERQCVCSIFGDGTFKTFTITMHRPICACETLKCVFCTHTQTLTHSCHITGELTCATTHQTEYVCNMLTLLGFHTIYMTCESTQTNAQIEFERPSRAASSPQHQTKRTRTLKWFPFTRVVGVVCVCVCIAPTPPPPAYCCQACSAHSFDM